MNQNPTKHTKVLIIGSGPAGYTAAVYAARAMLKPILVSGMEAGGQLTTTTDVENYPGFAEVIQGPWLMGQMKDQAKAVGTEIIEDHISSVNLKSKPFEAIGERIGYYRDEIEKQGREFDPYSVAVTRGLMVANNDHKRKEAHILRGKFITEVQVLATDKKFQAKSFNPVADARWKDRGDPDMVSEDGAILGNSEEMGERVQKLYDLGVRNILAHDLSGSSESLQQFAEEVMPHFIDKEGPVAQAAE